LALAVPLSRFTPRAGGGSAFFVRRLCAVVVISVIQNQIMNTPQNENNTLQTENLTASLKKLQSCDADLKPKLEILQVEIIRLLGGSNWGGKPPINMRMG
jgi:hypothetical protein